MRFSDHNELSVEPRKIIHELFSSAFYLPDSEFRIVNSRFLCLKSGCIKIPERKTFLVLDSSKRLGSGFRHIVIQTTEFRIPKQIKIRITVIIVYHVRTSKASMKLQLVTVRTQLVAKKTNLLSHNNFRHYHHNNHFYHCKHSDDQYIDHYHMETGTDMAYSSSERMLVLVLLL